VNEMLSQSLGLELGMNLHFELCYTACDIFLFLLPYDYNGSLSKKEEDYNGSVLRRRK
jgi:hypothetical protein